MMPGKFKGELSLTWLNKTWWRIDHPITYTTAAGEKYLVHKGLITDLGSIPRGLWNILHRSEFAPAYVIHDMLYSVKLVNRREADRILNEAIYTLTAGDATGKRAMIWLAVRLFGGWAWRKARLKPVGKKRPKRTVPRLPAP